MVKNYRVVFNTKGFDPERDIGKSKWEKICGLFIKRYNEYANSCNKIQETINDIWSQFECIKATGNKIVSEFTTTVMGIDPESTYEDWCAKWYKDVTDAMNIAYKFDELIYDVFRDGVDPIFGARFRKNKDWTIDFYLVEAE